MGKHYHLYRLPDSIERVLLKCLQDKKSAELIIKSTSTRDIALNRLRELVAQNIEPSEGPIAVGDYSDNRLQILLKKSLAHYLRAFENNYKTFPYLRFV